MTQITVITAPDPQAPAPLDEPIQVGENGPESDMSAEAQALIDHLHRRMRYGMHLDLVSRLELAGQRALADQIRSEAGLPPKPNMVLIMAMPRHLKQLNTLAAERALGGVIVMRPDWDAYTMLNQRGAVDKGLGLKSLDDLTKRKIELADLTLLGNWDDDSYDQLLPWHKYAGSIGKTARWVVPLDSERPNT